MSPDELEAREARDILFYETEAPDGFLARLESERVFDFDHWQRLWDAVASLIQYQNGTLDIWSSYDLKRVLEIIEAEGQNLIGQHYDSLNDFEKSVLEANLFIRDVFTSV